MAPPLMILPLPTISCRAQLKFSKVVLVTTLFFSFRTKREIFLSLTISFNKFFYLLLKGIYPTFTI